MWDLSSPTKQLRELLQKEQAFWQQRSRVLWLAVGDLNTKYFHQKVSNRRKKNTLRGLYNSGGQWCVEEDEIQAIVLDYYTSLFKTSNSTMDFEDLHGVPRVITEEVNQSLMREVTAEEVWRALKQMHPSKAPGPDGLSPIFYQQFWDVVGGDVVEGVKGFLYSEEFLRDKLHKGNSHPKSEETGKYAAAETNKLILDNSLFAFEISHCLKKRRRGKVGYGALKIDMNKAYNRVEWRQFAIEEDGDEFQGVRVCTGAPAISHLFFADDSFVFFKARGARVPKSREHFEQI
ncbi:hypothetical protein ACLB2K_063336 [Fragaria x ananassa]